ncbi:MAG TPA: hypothetical protein ENJ18_17340 [Nannocystis exedens]|nr:hypothetical protein [Nannocystis exedens]
MMSVALLFGLCLFQAPVAAPPPVLQDRQLGQAFRLKTGNFLAWQPMLHTSWGWKIELVPTFTAEITPTDPRFSRLSLSVETSISPIGSGAVGLVRPRVLYNVRGQTQIGLEFPFAAAFSSAIRGSLGRPNPWWTLIGHF